MTMVVMVMMVVMRPVGGSVGMVVMVMVMVMRPVGGFFRREHQLLGEVVRLQIRARLGFHIAVAFLCRLQKLIAVGVIRDRFFVACDGDPFLRRIDLIGTRRCPMHCVLFKRPRIDRHFLIVFFHRLLTLLAQETFRLRRSCRCSAPASYCSDPAKRLG